MSQEEKKEIGRASTVMATFTMLSRLLGLVRNQILSHFFGSGMVADAFVAAFTIPNALRRLFGEGALTPAFVTTLTRALKESEAQKDPRIWQNYMAGAFTGLTLMLLIVCGLGMLLAPWIVRIYVPEFNDIPGKIELTTELTRFLFPFILFIGWSAFFMGILNTFKSFGLPAFGPALLNITVILMVPTVFLFVSPQSPYAIHIYGLAMLIGGLLQAAVQLPKLAQLGAFPRFKSPLNDPRVRELALILVPSAFAMGVYQLNIIVNRVFASNIEGAVSHLFYADLILELPVSLVAVSLGTAVLPSFSRLLTDKNRVGFAETFSFSLEGVWLLSLPAMAGFIALAEPIVSTLYLSGKFVLHDLNVVSTSLIAYSIGLPFFAALRILTPVFFAEKDTRTPARVGFVALFVNLLAAWQFSKLWGTWGIAFATSVSSFANFAILVFLIQKKFPEIQWKPVVTTLFKIIVACTVMGLSLHGLTRVLDPELWLQQGFSISKVVYLTLLIFVGALIYFFCAKALHIPQAGQMIDRVMRRKRS